MTDLSAFCEHTKMVDEHFKLATVDLMFISTNMKTKGTIKNKAGLIRCEFLEFLVRTAKWKYLDKKTDGVTNYTEAFTKRLEECIKKNYTPVEW